MATGTRKRARQPSMWVTTTDLPIAKSHPFYPRLNQLPREHGFDDFAEAQCAWFHTAAHYLETLGICTCISEPDRGSQAWTTQHAGRDTVEGEAAHERGARPCWRLRIAVSGFAAFETSSPPACPTTIGRL